MSTPPERTAIVLTSVDSGYSVDLKLLHNPKDLRGEIIIPPLDILTLAMTYLLTSASEALEDAINTIHLAYEKMHAQGSADDAVREFNETIGLDVYYVA